jgi:multicomponent Na+:H+ antiporter subunit D
MSPAALASLLPLPVAIPITGAVLAPLVARVSRRGALVAAVVALTSTTVVLCLLAPTVYRGHVLVQFLGNVRPVRGHALGVAFAADPFGITYALLAASIGSLLVLAALSELEGFGPREIGGFACLFQLLLAALIGSALTGDLIDLFVWFEVAALASYGLTGFFLERPFALEAAFKILVLTNVAAFFVFIGAAFIYSGHGALNFGQIHNALALHSGTADTAALALLIAGFATKAGLMPFHGWLADAHTASPGPVSALFSGLMVNLGIVALARLSLDVWAGSGRGVLGLLTVLGATSAVLGAVLALAQDDLKRLLAYDTVSQMGVLAVGIGTGSVTGLAGMTYHLIDHALFKSLLFLCAGAIVHATGMTKLSEMGGLAHHRPVTTAAFVIGAAAIAGVPLLNGYVSVGLIHDALRDQHPATFAVMLIAQIITVAALARATYLAFFRRRDDDYDSLERPRPGMSIAFGVLSAACVVFGVLPDFVLRHVAAPAAAALTESTSYSHAVIGGGGVLTVPQVSFAYFSPAELLTAFGTIAAGLLLAWGYLRLSAEPWPVRALRAIHTGSVNDYAAYSAFGLVATFVAVIVAR